MNLSAAHERLPLTTVASNPMSANPRCSRAIWSAGRGSSAALGLLLVGILCTPAASQTAAPQIRSEFRTAPRSLITQTIDRSRLARTEGAVARQVAAAQDLGVRDPSAIMEHIQLVLQRPRERQAAFDAQVEALHQRGNPSYHKWLTPEIVGAEFGPSASDLATLTSYLQSEGFTVNVVGRSGTFVDFTGTVAQVQQSFHTEIHNLRLATGEEHYSAVSDAQLPEALAPLVAGFVALGNVPSAHPNYRKAVPPEFRAVPPNNIGATPLDDVSSSNYAVGPQDFYTIYNELPLLNASTPINGTGVTIALLEESDITQADVTYFRTLYGVNPPTPVSMVVEAGYGSNTCTAPAKLVSDGEEGEAILDIEWTGSVAPGANLIFMECASTSSTLGVFLSAEAVIENNLADIMSLSYGEYEAYSSSQDTLVNDLWEQAASQGETVVVSAGDTGPATEDGNYGDTYARYGITVSGFSSTAWNVSAGGTDFQDLYNQDRGDTAYDISAFWNSSNGTGLESAKSYIPETTWNDTCASSIYAKKQGDNDPATLCGNTAKHNLYLVAGGGGPSTLYPRPSWQTGTVFGLPSASAFTNAGNRLQPDVSLFASNGFWDHDLPSYESDASTPLSYAGGTSFVAPQLAGIFALIKQKTGERLGQPNYVLYNMAGSEFGVGSFTGSSCNGSGASGIGTTTSTPSSTCIFYDIQTGNISVDCAGGDPDCYTLAGKTYGVLSTSTSAEDPAYPTNSGWDVATGIGSINITNLVNNWQTAAAGGVLYTPTINVASTSASYTYGLPPAISFTATVSGAGSYPTGSVTFSGSGAISTIGNDALAGSTGCMTGSTCTELATQAYTPPAALAAGSYTITGAYLSTNENYATGSGTTALTVNKQTPTVSVTALSIGVGAATANLSATVAYTGSGNAPTGGLTFQVDSGTIVSATCVGPSSPLTCTYSGYNTSALTLGAHTITATSIADGNYARRRGPTLLACCRSRPSRLRWRTITPGPAVLGICEFELLRSDCVFSGQRAGDDRG
jgi:subtilase family serine protease